ncbi:MAG: ERCC4 domain-containing protein [Planctomycetes bacterium]|nr:ERCC4 domain-containing protein [Planctomycetota bacterium]
MVRKTEPSNDPVVLIDTREQAPWTFTLATEAATLDTGDYSIKGLERLIAVERKSLGDLLGCVGRHRDCFKRELQRMRGYRFRALIIEATLAELDEGNWRGLLKPSHVLGSLAAWQAQYSLPILLAGDRHLAAAFAERYLFQCARALSQEHTAVSVFVKA